MTRYATLFEQEPATPGDSAADAPCRSLWTRLRSRLPEVEPCRQDSRTLYLDLAEHIVRIASDWVNGDGAVIDPVDQAEHGQTSPRFAAPAAVLLASGRIADLEDTVLRCMDWSCMRLATGQANSPDFWMRELMTAYRALQPIVDADRAATWAAHIRSVDPERINVFVERDGKRIEDLHNWTVYAAAGEAMRAAARLTHDDPGVVCGHAFFDKYMPPQMRHFTEHGMYRDPGVPLTYDMTTRLQFTIALAAGYRGPLHAQVDAHLVRGAITQLFYVSPHGYAPFGGRSSQMHLQEAILAAICEYEARRHAASEPDLAGAFKRQGRRSAQAVRRWITDMDPMRHVKNGFDPATRHGCDGYAKLSVYSLFAASCLAVAAAFADDDIPEAPCPAEHSRFVLPLQPAFHKVFIQCGDTQLAVDTAADPHHDATGIGRFARDGVPTEFALAMPLTATPHYALSDEHRPLEPMAIGPAWRIGGEWTRLAALTDGLSVTVTEQDGDGDDDGDDAPLPFEITYRHAASQVTVREQGRLAPGVLAYRAQIEAGRNQSVEAVRLIVPLLDTDGQRTTELDVAEGRVRVIAPDGRYEIRFDPSLAAAIAAHSVGNRNGLYRSLIIEASGSVIEATLELSPGATSDR